MDEESERKLGSLRTGIALTVTLFVLVIAGCAWKIKQYSNSIVETREDI